MTNKVLKAAIITVATMASLLIIGLLGVSAAEDEKVEAPTTEVQQMLGDPLIVEEPAEIAEPKEVSSAWWASDQFAPKVIVEPTTAPQPEPTEVVPEYSPEPTTVPETTEPTTTPEPTTEPEPTEPATDPAPTEPEPTEPTTPEPTTPEPTEPTTPEPTTPDPTPEPTPDPTPDYPSDPETPTEDYFPSPEMDVLGAVRTGEDNRLNLVLAIIALAAACGFVFLTFTKRREEAGGRYHPRHMRR